MKKSTSLLITISLVIGLLVTVGLTRVPASTSMSFVKVDNNCSLYNHAQVGFCGSVSRGYPLTYLHSNAAVSTDPTSPGDSKNLGVTSISWLEFKTMAADWLIWSVAAWAVVAAAFYLIDVAHKPSRTKKRRK